MVAAPAVVLAIRAASDIALMDWRIALPVVVAAAAACSALVATGAPRTQPSRDRLRRPDLIVYAYDMIAQADVRLDDSPSTIYPATIMERLVSTGRGHAHTFVRRTGAPTMTRCPTLFGVKPDLFDRFGEGDRIGAFVRRGSPALTWYALDGRPAGLAQ